MHNDGLLKEAETMTEKSAFDKTLGELHDLIEWEDAEAAIRELHARQPEMERLYLNLAMRASSFWMDPRLTSTA